MEKSLAALADWLREQGAEAVRKAPTEPLAARLLELAEAGAAALAERDDELEAENFLIRSVRRAEAEGRLPPLPEEEHHALLEGLLTSAGQRPPSWADEGSRPSPGSWCSCCGRHRRLGGRWWRPVAPRSDGLAPGPGWRCAVCHPPPPGCEVEEVVT